MRRVVEADPRFSTKKVWPPPGSVTYRRCADTVDKRGMLRQCEEAALVAVVPGRFPLVVEEQPRCKRHGGRK